MQAGLRPMFALWDGEVLTDQVRRHASTSQIQVFAVYVTHNDLVNGGVRQWLFNSSSCLHPAALDGYRVLGLPAAADLLAAVVDLVFPGGFAFDVQQRRDLLVDDPRDDGSSALSRSLDAADPAYYRLTGSWDGAAPREELAPDLESLLLAWMVEHPDEFFVEPPTNA